MGVRNSYPLLLLLLLLHRSIDPLAPFLKTLGNRRRRSGLCLGSSLSHLVSSVRFLRTPLCPRRVTWRCTRFGLLESRYPTPLLCLSLFDMSTGVFGDVVSRVFCEASSLLGGVLSCQSSFDPSLGWGPFFVHPGPVLLGVSSRTENPLSPYKRLDYKDTPVTGTIPRVTLFSFTPVVFSTKCIPTIPARSDRYPTICHHLVPC